MLRTTACMTQQHRLLTIIIIIKTLEKYSELYPIHSDFSFVRKWHKQLKKIASMEVCQEGLTSGNLLEKTTGWAETRMSGRWFPYVQVRGGLGFILQVIAAKPEHPKLTLEKLPSLNGLILHGWTTVLHSQKTKLFSNLKTFLSSVEKWFIRSFPGRWRGCLRRLTLFFRQGSGMGWGTGPHLETKRRATGVPTAAEEPVVYYWVCNVMTSDAGMLALFGGICCAHRTTRHGSGHREVWYQSELPWKNKFGAFFLLFCFMIGEI